MLRVLSVLFFFVGFGYGTILIGDQKKVAIIHGKGYVESNGIRKNFQSGEVIYTKQNEQPSDPKKIAMGTLNNVYNNLKPSNDEKLICIKYAMLDLQLADKIKNELINLKVKSSSIYMQKINDKIEIFLANVNIEKIKTLYPVYYKLALHYFDKEDNIDEIPIFTMNTTNIQNYHRNFF